MLLLAIAMFSRGERKEPGMPRVEIDATLDTYRHTHWTPYSELIEGLQGACLEASAAGRHLWASTERLSAYSLATWMATGRQAVGHALLVAGENAEGTIPTDVATLALTNYQEAERWLHFRQDVNLDPAYTQEPGSIDTTIAWPTPDASTYVSLEIMLALKATVDELAYIQHPVIDGLVVDSDFVPSTFRFYKKRLTEDADKIQKRIDVLSQQWSDRLNPNVEPGKQVYHELVSLVEALLTQGAHKLMPITQDSRYLAALRQNRPIEAIAPSGDPEFIFDVNTLGITRQPSRPSGKPFMPAGLLPGNPTSREPRPDKPFSASALLHSPSAQSEAKPFDPTLFIRPTVEASLADVALTAAVEPKKEKPFDPANLTGNTVAQAPDAAEARPFDPGSILNTPRPPREEKLFTTEELLGTDE